MLKASLIAAAALAFAGVAAPRAAAPASRPVARLANDVVPVAYDLTLGVDLGALRTSGEETIDVRVLRPVGSIALNVQEIDLHASTLDGAPARSESLPGIEQIVVGNGTPIRPGVHRLVLRFGSTVHNGGRPSGLFVSAGEHAAMITGLFEPSSARSVFPCFDEPAFRARMTLHVRAPSEWTVVSNMPLLAKRPSADGLAQSDFETTPPMPVYMLTLDAGVMAHVDGAAGSVPIRVFTEPGQEERARTMLADAQRLLPFYAAYFGTPFPLPKLDLVVAPGGLQTAFEGWGAITFYSEATPFGLSYPGDAGRRAAVEVLAHEMAHQWTGDLVTMHWWRDTFVSEGLAQFAQRVSTRAVFPELRTWLDDDRFVGWLLDNPVTAQSKPVLGEIRGDLEDEDRLAFDSATYDKGASVVEGWRAAIGDEAFRARLAAYLRRFAYGSATFEDFWDAMGGADGVAYGHSWLARRGYPLVDVRAGCVRGGTQVRVEQRPFIADPHVDASYRAQRWIVPVELRVGTRTRALTLRGSGAWAWYPGCERVAVNPGERPYYVVRYDSAAYGALVPERDGSDRDRAREYRDAALLHANGELADVPYLRLIRTAREPLEPSVWVALANEYRRMDALVRGTPQARTLTLMQRDALLPVALRYGRIGSEARGPFQLGSRSALALAEAGDAVAGSAYRDDYTALTAGKGVRNFQAAYVTPILAAAVATSGDVDGAEAELRAKDPSSPMTPPQELFIENVADESLAHRVLDDAMRDPHLLTGTSRLAFVGAIGARHPALGYAYLQAHVDELRRGVPPTQQAWSIATVVASALWPAAPPAELEAFLRAHFPSDRATVREAGTIIRRNWAQRRSLLNALRAIGG
ncbi:MAG TPA: M1 family metallopeptidase [Candidatus Elarobacter sp.]|nr:M1 family metallopeptidase [Candidatus Elarobacter sp.]